MILKEKLKKKELTIGSWLSFGYTPITEMMCRIGFEWLVIDMEHTSISSQEALQMMQIISAHNITPLIRVGENNELIIKKAMDSGAHGVVVPMINNKVEAEKAVNAVKYPPVGNRGVGLFRAQNYGISFDEYKKWLELNSIVIVQIEHIDGVKNIADIMNTEGIDAFIVGPYDLSASMGHPGNFDHPDVKDALNSLVEFMNQSNKPGGFHVVHSNIQDLQNKIKQGYNFLAYGDDMVFISEKFSKEQKNLKQLLDKK